MKVQCGGSVEKRVDEVMSPSDNPMHIAAVFQIQLCLSLISLGFDRYFISRTLDNNRRNIWFAEFWENNFQCKLSRHALKKGSGIKKCTSKSRMSLFTMAYSYAHSVYDLTDTIASFSILNILPVASSKLPGPLIIQILSIKPNRRIITILHLSN